MTIDKIDTLIGMDASRILGLKIVKLSLKGKA